MKFMLSHMVNTASSVVINGYSIDEFEITGQELFLACEGVQEFKIIDQEVQINGGQVRVSGYTRPGDCLDRSWEPQELLLTLSILGPLTEDDL